VSSIGGPKPLLLTPFSAQPPGTSMQLLCDGFVARNVSSLVGLVTELRALQAAHPGKRILATLDSLHQACYTAFEAGEHRGYLSTPSEFPIRRANLLKQAKGLSPADLRGVLFWAEPGMVNDPATINREAELALDLAAEPVVLIQIVPVETAPEVIAALPNGYFTSDLNPMQNYVLAEHLRERFGLELFGIGARFLGFWRDQPLSAEQADDLAEDLVQIYTEAPDNAAVQLGQALRGRDLVLVRYTET
jgi:hypothetical protein